MRDFMLSRGWLYQGQCNCTPKMDIYRHPSLHPRYEVRLNNTQFRIKDITYPVARTIINGNASSFESTYERFFNTKP